MDKFSDLDVGTLTLLVEFFIKEWTFLHIFIQYYGKMVRWWSILYCQNHSFCSSFKTNQPNFIKFGMEIDLTMTQS